MPPPAAGFQPSLLATGRPAADVSFSAARRIELSDGAWVDQVPGWLAGADTLFGELLDAAHWATREVAMYGRTLPEPRLHACFGPGGPPAPLPDLAELLGTWLGVRFDSIAASLYRDGSDSVAWHGDRVHRGRPVATVAVLSLGSQRRFLLRPLGGGRSVTIDEHRGDLVVMGGTCQRTWQHCVPKVAHAGPRVSVSFRQRVNERPGH